MFEKEPIAPSIPKEIKAADSTSFIFSSFSPQWLSYISTIQNRLSKWTRLLKPAVPSSSAEEEMAFEADNDIYTLFRTRKIQKTSTTAPSSILAFFQTSSLPNLDLHKSNVNSSHLDISEEFTRKGYALLAKQLKGQEGFPWDTIKTISNPLLVEQLLDLYTLCQSKTQKSHSEFDSKKILDFALNLANIATSSTLNEDFTRAHEALEQTKYTLGQLIYLMDHDLNEVAKIFKLSPQDAIENLQTLFDDHFKRILVDLQTHYRAYQSAQLQSAELALYNRIPLEIAKALLTSKGTVNTGLINVFYQQFITSPYPLNHQLNLAYGLNTLKHSFDLRKEMESIQAPQSPVMPSNDVIRAILNLSPDESITDVHAKQVILSALLSHLRQDETGSCFATSLAIELLASHLHVCLKDLQQLLFESKLTRTLKGVKRDIPFIKSISDPDLTKSFIINKQGYLMTNNKEQTLLWDIPSLQTAASAIGIKNLKEALTVSLLQSISASQSIDCQTVLKALCEYVATQDASKKNKLGSLFAQACFAFSSQTHPALLKVWENAIANMAEAQEEGMIKSYILDAVLHVLQLKLAELQVPPSNFIRDILQEIKKNLYATIQLQYDPSVKGMPDGHAYPIKRQGGFVLYVKNQRIDQGSVFIKYLADLIFHSCKKFKKSNLNKEEQQSFNLLTETLIPYLNTEDFLTRLLIKYHPSNASALIQSSRIENLNYTPWITLKGNKSKAVLEVYLEYTQPIHTDKLNQLSLEDRLLVLIKIGQKMTDKNKQAYLSNTNKANLLRIPGWHTSRIILLGHPCLSAVLKGEQTAENWLNGIKTSGMHIAESIIDKDTRNQLFKTLHQFILPSVFEGEKLNNASQLLSQIPSHLSIKETRQSLIQILQKQSEITATELAQYTRQIDTALYDSLNSPLKKQLENSIIPIIDTNWNEDVDDIHLYAVVNPGTGQFEIWQAHSNGIGLQAISQKEWMQEWECFSIPEDILKSDSTH